MPRAPSAPLFAWPSAWEYRELVVAYDGEWESAFNALGEDGWMLVTIIHDETVGSKDEDVRAIFQRPRAAKARAKAKPATPAEADDSEDEEEANG